MISLLYVDDEDPLLDVTRIYLEKTGEFTVDTAQSATIALEKIKTHHYDAIVSDYQMPVMDGIAFLTELRKEYPHLPFLIFTGKGRDEVIIKAFEQGADFYLQKGGDPKSQFAEMAHKIKSAVNFRQEHKALQESETRFRALIENASDVIRILDRDGKIVFDTAASSRSLGYPPEYTSGKSPFEFIHPDDQPLVKKALSEVFQESNPGIPTEFRIRKMDGSYTWVESIGKNLLGVPGIDGIVVTTRSIDERKRSEEALKNSEENYRLLFEHATEGILIAQDNRLVHVNPAFLNILGRPLDVITSKPFWEFIHPEDREMVMNRHIQRMRGENPPTGYVFRILNGQGEVKWLWINSTRITWSGEPATLSFLTDISEQKQLIETKNRLGRILEESLNEIYVFDAVTLRFIDVNRGARENLGYRMDELQSMTPVDIKPGYTREMFETLIAPLRTGSQQELEFSAVHQRKDGTCYPVEVHMQFSKNEEPPIFVSFVLDISQRREAEEALRENEAKYRLIAENSADCIWIATLDLKFTYISPAITKLRGISVEEAMAQSPADFMTAASLSLVQSVLQEELEIERSGKGDPNRSRSIEFTELRADGTQIWVSNTVSFLRDAEGNPVAILGISRDITDRKRMTEALMESEQRYSALFDHNYSVSLLIDPDTGRIVGANDAASRYYGYSREHLLGMGISDLNRIPSDKVVRDLFKAKNEREKHFFSTHYLANGERRNVEIYSGPITIHGKPLFYSIIHDITARTRAEEALRNANRQMQLLTGITRHDILNSIMVAEGYLDLLDDTESHSLSSCRVKIHQTLRKIRKQIQFTREYETLGSQEPTWLSLDALMHALEIPQSVQFDKDRCDAEVFADPMLGKVFENLLDNSLRHGGAALTRIEVTCSTSGKDLLINWKDNGEGIALREKEMIFERGYGKGTGLGLFLTREILGITGLTIHETGVPGEGARFEIRVPEGLYRIQPAPN